VDVALALVVGSLYGMGLYLMLRRSMLKLVIGLGLLGHAANLLIFTVAGLTRARPPITPIGLDGPPPAPYADPVPQSLVLTAIVIGFGVQAFTLVLLYRTYAVTATDDLDELRERDT
jgi:multicomponent Na+:H+ antiporter subunit C